jgi:N-methylhydantoinase A/oxoprolinase/acetone carboxylase beta subunit
VKGAVRIGVDTGGTFTDIVRLDDSGIRIHKVRSTPDDPARAILAGIAEIASEEDITEVVHGSTVATNAVLERKGARVGLITTRGFEDVIAIGRQTRRRLYDFQVRSPDPLVDRSCILGVTERLDHTGRVLFPLDIDELDCAIAQLTEQHVECVAVCFLHSYQNPEHEDIALDRLLAAGLTATASHDVLPEYREYERWSTTLVNASVTPVMSRYLARLEDGLQRTRLHVMQSNGGIISAVQARNSAVRTILSGPAAGAVGGQAVARASGFDRVILFDMGGTSTDVSLMDGAIGLVSESIVGGFPVRVPMLDIHTVGAGGGSIAYLDSGGSLRVGPRSAGADPGPVCYGKGNDFTVSDANLLLGRLPSAQRLAGHMNLDLRRTQQRATVLATDWNLTPERLAEGMIQIANSNMEHAIRAVSVQRGYDPREFALLAFGGAGCMHICEIAEAMDIDTILIPQHAGVLSALGMLLADVRKDYSTSVLRATADLSSEFLEIALQSLLEKAWADLEREGFGPEQIVLERIAEMRYRGQSFEISVPVNDDFEAEFHRRHEILYGYANPTRATEVVTIRLNAAGITKKHALPSRDANSKPIVAPLSRDPVWFHGGWTETPAYSRQSLLPGMSGNGPAIIFGTDSTVVITPAFRFTIDGTGTLIAIRHSAHEAQHG